MADLGLALQAAIKGDRETQEVAQPGQVLDSTMIGRVEVDDVQDLQSARRDVNTGLAVQYGVSA